MQARHIRHKTEALSLIPEGRVSKIEALLSALGGEFLRHRTKDVTSTRFLALRSKEPHRHSFETLRLATVVDIPAQDRHLVLKIKMSVTR